MSNVNAENDGVMSLRVGRKWPDPIHSTIAWFYKKISILLLASVPTKCSDVDMKAHLNDTFVTLCKTVWQEYKTSVAAERIIADHYGRKTPTSVLHIGREYGLLVNDLMISPYINV